MKELNNQQYLNNFVKTDELYKNVRSSGERQRTIKTVGSWRLASIGGSIATVVFVISLCLIPFAPFQPQDEIEMMKLIGAISSEVRL